MNSSILDIPFANLGGPFNELGFGYRHDQALADSRDIKKAVQQIASHSGEFSTGPFELALQESAEANGAQMEAIQESLRYQLEAQSQATEEAAEARQVLCDILVDISRSQRCHIALTSTLLQVAQGTESKLGYMLDALDDLMHAVVDSAREHDRLAELHHAELLQAVKSPNENKANEKHNDGLAQFDAGHMPQAARDLRDAIKLKSTHVPALLLLGRVCVMTGLVAEAKELLRRAANLAKRQAHLDAYVSAAVRLSHVERIVGNFASAHNVLVDVQTHLREIVASEKEEDDEHEDGDYDRVESSLECQARTLLNFVDYEELKARWAVPSNQTAEVAYTVAWGLYRLMCFRPELRDEVAHSPLFETCRAFCPWLNNTRENPIEHIDESVHLLEPLVRRLVENETLPDDHVASRFRRVLVYMAELIGSRLDRSVGEEHEEYVLQDSVVETTCLHYGFEGANPPAGLLLKLLHEKEGEIRFLEVKTLLHAQLVRQSLYGPPLSLKAAEAIERELKEIKKILPPLNYAVIAAEMDATPALFAAYHAVIKVRDDRLREETKQAAEAQQKRDQAEKDRLALRTEKEARVRRWAHPSVPRLKPVPPPEPMGFWLFMMVSCVVASAVIIPVFIAAMSLAVMLDFLRN